jgi:TonB family protein
MINHLTEDQIVQWFAGQPSAAEQEHVRECGACMAETNRFRETLELFREALGGRVSRTPQLSAIVCKNTAGMSILAEGSSGALWSKDNSVFSRTASLLVHAAFIGILVLPVAARTGLLPTETVVTMLAPPPLIFQTPLSGRSGGGGGGGRNTLTPPSKGQLPRAADKQILPPLVEVKNLAPELVVESTIVAPQLTNPVMLGIPIGDPNGVVGPPSAGPGTGGGVGTGEGTGVGAGVGQGAGPGNDVGFGGGVLSVGGGVSEPVLVSRRQPEYSDDGRRGRVQGTVELLIVVRADGTVLVDRVTKSLGYGLDQKAIEAVQMWKFQPGRKDGQAVNTWVSVLVNFTLR